MFEQFFSQSLQGKFHLDLSRLTLVLRIRKRLHDLIELFSLGLNFLTWENDQIAVIGLGQTRWWQTILRTVIIRSQRSQEFWDTASTIDCTIGMVVLDLFLDDAHFNLEVLDKHLDCLFVLLAEGDNHICVLHRWSDKVIIGRFDKPIVLSKDIHYCSTAIRNVSFNYSS